MENRRSYPRRLFDRPVGVLLHGEYFSARGIDIGEGGISLKVRDQIAEGSRVVVSFQVPGGEFVFVRGVVLQERKSGDGIYGVEFENLLFDRRREIRTYVSDRSASEQ